MRGGVISQQDGPGFVVAWLKVVSEWSLHILPVCVSTWLSGFFLQFKDSC